MGQTALDLYNRIKVLYENENLGDGDQAILRRIAIVAANGGIAFHYFNQVPDIKLSKEVFPCACLPLMNNLDRTVVDSVTIQKTVNNFKTCYRYKKSEANLRLFLWDPLLMSLLTNGVDDEKFYGISSECPLKNFAEFGEISKKIDFALLSKKFKLPMLHTEIGTDSIHYPFAHKDSSKTVQFHDYKLHRSLQKDAGRRD